MITFQDFFSSDHIIRYLCNKRMAYSRRAHAEEYFERLSLQTKKKPKNDEILKYMPSRSRWIRAPKSKRYGNPSHDQNKFDLLFTVERLREQNNPQDEPWITAQNEIVTKVKKRVLSSNCIHFCPPRIQPILKSSKSNEYRIVGSYDKLEDAIIIGLCADYLRHIFEYYFLPCSFAFRVSKDNNSPPTHHDAFKELAKFWQKHQKNGIIEAYAAECDIQGFYDTINHKVILKCYYQAVNSLAQCGIYVDSRAELIINAYLESYSYNRYAINEAKRRIPKNGSVKDRDKTLQELYQAEIDFPYGIPQGGALSGFFANLLLHEADRTVLNKFGDEVTFLRFCDDIITVGLEKTVVKQSLQEYMDVLKRLKLACHEPKEFNEYGKEFWDGKSKSVYKWGKINGDSTSVPWLAFVGYHLRYDGYVRVRPKSIHKELEKQADITSRFLYSVIRTLKEDRAKRTISELLASLENRLRAGAIGRRHEWDIDVDTENLVYCWCAGFRELSCEFLPKEQPILQTQLRQLDRGLGRQLARARGIIKPYKKVKGYIRPKKRRRRLKFKGKPRSYSGQF